MDTRDFLRQILPPEGPYFISTKTAQWKDHPVNTVEEATDKINQYLQHSSDIYVSTGSYANATTRTGTNAAFKKIFYIDLDCEGANASYNGKKAAVAKLRELLAEKKLLPPTFVVDSGRGVHVYWALDTHIPVWAWQKIANVFKRHLLDIDLLADPTVTADVARVMRVPGTVNQKNMQDCRVLLQTGATYSVESFVSVLPKRKASQDPMNNVTPIRPGVGILTDKTADLIGTSNQTRYFSQVVDQCAVLRNEKMTGGAGASYPLWFATMNFLAFCDDGADWWRGVSSMHPTYSEVDAERVYLRAVADKESGKLGGATKCETFHGCAPDLCSACPHWSSPERGKSWSSPIHFGVQKPKTFTNSDLPYPYVPIFNGTGIIVKDAEGNQTVEFAMRPKLTNPDVFEADHSTDNHIAFDFEMTSGKRRVYIPASMLSKNDRALYVALTSQGIVLRDPEIPHFKRLLVDWYDKVATAKGKKTPILQYGWQPNETPTYVIGNMAYSPNGVETQVRAVDHSLSTMFTAKGSEAKWHRLVDRALQAKHIESEVIFASAFAAPLVQFAGVSGCILSAVSPKSGTGKSLAMKLGQSVWGQPVGLINQMNDTPNSLTKRLSVANTMPAYWDEVRVNDKDGAKFIDFLYRCTQGREKSRMKADTTLQDVPMWKTMMVCASNAGIQEHIAQLDRHTNAGMLRVLEFTVSPLNRKLMANPHGFGALDNNYGHIGVKYAKWLVDNHDKVETAVKTLVDALHKSLGAEADERFYLSTVATLIIGAKIAKSQGWVNFDVDGIQKFLIDNYKRGITTAREEVESDDGSRNALGILRQFMASQADHTVITNWAIRPKNPPVCQVRAAAVRQPITIRYGQDDKLLLVDLVTLRRWLYESHGLVAAHLDALVAMGGYIKLLRPLTGMNAAHGINNPRRMLVIPFNMATASLFEANDDDTAATTPDKTVQ